jgi:SAM-dependent methyltransferase
MVLCYNAVTPCHWGDAKLAFPETRQTGHSCRFAIRPTYHCRSQLLRFRGLSFDLKYLLDQKPWDTGVTPPEVKELIESNALSPGRALDLGCGTGTNCIYLAHHGWEAVGVDFSAVAIQWARLKARRAGVTCQFHHADATDLSFLVDPFDLALDIGCLHSIPQKERQQYRAALSRLVRPGGLYMLYAFTGRPDRPTPRGVTPTQVRHLFAPAFVVQRQEGGDDPTGPQSAWYWLRRVGERAVQS